MGITTDEFVISLGLQDNITKKLDAIYRVANERATQIENRLRKAFSIPGAGTGGAIPPVRPAQSPRRRNYDERAYSAANNAQINRMMMGNSQSAIAAMEAKSKIWAASARANLDQNTAGFRRTIIDAGNNLRTFTARANGTFGTFGANANRASQGLARVGNSSTNAHNSLQKMVMGFAALHSMIHLLTESIQEGVERQRANNAMQFAYGENAAAQTNEVKKLSDTYGTNLSEALKQSSMLKNVLGGHMSDREIAQYHESLTVEGGMTGATEEEKNRFTLALEKMSGAKNGGGVQFVQMQKAMSGVMGRMAKSVKLTPTELREYAKGLSGQDFAKKVAEFMASDINTVDKTTGKTAKQAYAESEQVGLQRVQNDWIDTMVNLNESAKDGVGEFSRALSDLMRNNQWLSEELGAGLGGFLKDLSKGVTFLSDILIRLNGWRIDFDKWYSGLSPQMQNIVSTFGDFARGLVETYAIVRSLKAIVTGLQIITGVTDAMKALRAATVAAAGAEGATGLLALINPITALIAIIGGLLYLTHDRMTSDGNFYLNPEDAAKHEADIKAGKVSGERTSTAVAFGGLGFQPNPNSPTQPQNMRDYYQKQFDSVKSIDAEYKNKGTAYQADKFSLDVKTPQSTDVNITLDIDKLIQQINAKIDYKVESSEQRQAFGGNVMDYHPTQPPALPY